MSDLKRLCEKLGIKADVVMDGKLWREDWKDSNPWRVTLRYQRRQMTVPFYTGPAWEREPNAADVLACLCSDVSGVEFAGFEEWCGDLGFDTDSRKAERIYRECERLAPRLRRFLGKSYEQVCSAQH